LTADDQARLLHQLAFQQKLGLPLRWISAAEARRREPHLGRLPLSGVEKKVLGDVSELFPLWHNRAICLLPRMSVI
jgi:hypothetical protein